MSLRDDISKLLPPDYFVGGNNRQREKLNALVDAIRNMISSANNNVDPADDGATQTLLMTILANGMPANVVFTAYVATQPA